MAVPAWAAREWRPQARDLCARVLDKQQNASHVNGDDDHDDLSSAQQQHLLLRADKVIAKMYNHRYMEITPQQIAGELAQIATKMEIHLLPERAQRLRALAAGCDYRVLKLLIELAQSPTRASDASVAFDPKTAPLGALQAWNRLLTPNKAAQKAEAKAREAAALVASLETELLEVAWQDDWWKERMDDEDDETSDLENAMDLEMNSGSDGKNGEEEDEEEHDNGDSEYEDAFVPVARIGTRFLMGIEPSKKTKKTKKTKIDVDAGDGPVSGVCVEGHPLDKNAEAEGEEEEGDVSTDDVHDEDEDDGEDDLLLQYYLPVFEGVGGDDAMEVDAVSGGARKPHGELPAAPLPFSMETPSRLLPLVEAQNEYRQQRQSRAAASTVPLAPRREVIHEQVVVDAIFHALHGVESPLFDFQHKKCPYLFNGDFSTTQISPSSLMKRGLAVSHVSPLTMLSVLHQITQAASNLQFVRDVALFLQTFAAHEQHHQRSATAEGLAKELLQLLHEWQRDVEEIQVAMQDTMAPRAFQDLDGNDNDEVRIVPTVLATVGAFQKLFQLVARLRDTLTECFSKFHSQSRRKISAASLSSTILTSLYRQLKDEFMESAPVPTEAAVPTQRSSSCTPSLYVVLCRLFASSLTPYLDAIDQMLFTKGCDDRIPLHPELFFASSGGNESGVLSPRSAAQRLLEETFDDAMTSLLPFCVDTSVVPVFLEPLVPLMSSALASRQIMNRYVSTQQPSQPIITTPTPSLATLFFADFGSLLSEAKIRSTASLANAPFDQVVRVALTSHVETKCMELNGQISSLFRDKLQLTEHMQVLRLFFLMHQQDVFTTLSQFLIDQMTKDPIGWANTELLNGAFQDAIHNLHIEGLLTTTQREIAARLSIRVDLRKLEKLPKTTRQIDILALKCLQFRFTTTQPLRVLFSGSIVHKYSTLAILLLQVKVAELMLTNFKQDFRHRICFPVTQDPLRPQLVKLADMYHYTRSVLHYLANQMTGDAWATVERVLQTSQSIKEIHEAHDAYLNKMLHHFFVLKKHDPFTRQFLQNFNDVIAFVSRVDDFVGTVERNMTSYFELAPSSSQAATATTGSHQRGRLAVNRGGSSSTLHQRSGNRWARGGGEITIKREFSTLYKDLLKRLQNPQGNFENQLHVITIVLEYMVKNGASPHVNELLVLLTFNHFRSPSTKPR